MVTDQAQRLITKTGYVGVNFFLYDFKPKGKPCQKKKLFTRGKKICLRYGNWLKRIRIAFEHENAIDGTQGAYQEICHLITVKAENKVLVGYLANHTPQEYAEDFQSIIKDSGTKDNVLLILGYKKVVIPFCETTTLRIIKLFV